MKKPSKGAGKKRKRHPWFDDPKTRALLFGDVLIGLLQPLREKVRLHGYFVSRDILHPLSDTGRRLRGQRCFVVGSDGFSLVDNPTVVTATLARTKTDQEWEDDDGPRNKPYSWIRLYFCVSNLEGEIRDVNIGWGKLSLHGLANLAKTFDMNETRRRLFWILKDLVPAPSPKHWWPKPKDWTTPPPPTTSPAPATSPS